MTATMAVEGRMGLWEGERAASFLRARRGMRETPHRLPFQVRLDAYEMDEYPGTRQPAMFRSRVTVIEPSGRERPAVIEMNRPLSHGGYTFFQSSYQIDPRGREMSVLSVSKDPGQTVVFWGYYLLVLGMIVVLVTRIAQHREAERAQAVSPAAGGDAQVAAPAVGAGRGAPFAAPALAACAGLLALALSATPGAAQHVHRPPQTPPAALIEPLRRLPVQHDGREMPFDTQAREAVLTVTGQRQWRGIDPVAMAMGWTMDSEGWLGEPIVKVDAHVADLAGLPRGARHASFRQLLASPRLRAVFGAAVARANAGRPQQPGDKSLLKLDERVVALDEYLQGHAIRAIPGAERRTLWSLPALPADPASYAGLEAQLRPGAPAHYPSAARIAAEIRYNAVNPVRIAGWLLLPAAIAAGLTLERNRWRLRWAALACLLLGFAVMTWGIAVRWQLAGRIPASNMYESMLFLGWGVGLFGVVAVLFRNYMLSFNAAAMSALVMLLLDRLPIDPFIHPMAPVLSGTPWLAIHVPIIMVSYSTFAIATFLAHMQLGVGLFAPRAEARARRWSELLYWYLIVGSILLIAGILTGSIWAAASWGRYWGWDPKEVWSLVAFLAYMAILHGRFDRFIGPFGVAVASIAAFWMILMTYIGVNFVLASGLHSYGFGSTSVVRVMGVVLVAEVLFLLAGWRGYRKQQPPAALRVARR
jgi:ABC-type transport system involved in cytochrome c biogenesis permease subunit